MSKSVDETVFDYFTTLLQEPLNNDLEPLCVTDKEDKVELVPKLAFSFEGKLAPKTAKEFFPTMEVDNFIEITNKLLANLDNEFQVLLFKVSDLTLAVPLISVGGIIKIKKIGALIDKPSWFMGTQVYKGKHLKVVNTAAWAMPLQYKNLEQTTEYQYLILLNKTCWGLACEELINVQVIFKDGVNWRTKMGKRPWLAGVVTENMSGILNVDALVQLLDKGLEYLA